MGLCGFAASDSCPDSSKQSRDVYFRAWLRTHGSKSAFSNSKTHKSLGGATKRTILDT